MQLNKKSNYTWFKMISHFFMPKVTTMQITCWSLVVCSFYLLLRHWQICHNAYLWWVNLGCISVINIMFINYVWTNLGTSFPNLWGHVYVKYLLTTSMRWSSSHNLCCINLFQINTQRKCILPYIWKGCLYTDKTNPMH